MFEKGPIDDLGALCKDCLEIPSIFKTMLMDRIKLSHAGALQNGKLTKAGFLSWFKDTDGQNSTPKRRLFNVIA